MFDRLAEVDKPRINRAVLQRLLLCTAGAAVLVVLASLYGPRWQSSLATSMAVVFAARICASWIERPGLPAQRKSSS